MLSHQDLSFEMTGNELLLQEKASGDEYWGPFVINASLSIVAHPIRCAKVVDSKWKCVAVNYFPLIASLLS